MKLTIGLYAHVRSGALNSVTNDVEKALGRPPRDFTDYARTAASQGRGRADRYARIKERSSERRR
ncbi:hypothetical protein ACFT7S_06935 [Streptomyces sp. NPDC057136]|uniref:hypothetical protein n=1 Tax=Streptomyces sp. NPDC057136 TaxID=3346029 RepID=UPI00362E3E42